MKFPFCLHSLSPLWSASRRTRRRAWVNIAAGLGFVLLWVVLTGLAQMMEP